MLVQFFTCSTQSFQASTSHQYCLTLSHWESRWQSWLRPLTKKIWNYSGYYIQQLRGRLPGIGLVASVIESSKTCFIAVSFFLVTVSGWIYFTVGSSWPLRSLWALHLPLDHCNSTPMHGPSMFLSPILWQGRRHLREGFPEWAICDDEATLWLFLRHLGCPFSS